MSDSIKFAPLPALLLPFLVLLLALTGCATQTENPAPSSEPEHLIGQPPAGAYSQNGRLLLQYSNGKQLIHLGAAWPNGSAAPRQHNYQTAVIDLLTEDVPEPAALQRDWRTVRLFGKERWDSLVQSLLEQSVPGNAESGTLVTIQGIDFVLQRDPSAKLHVYRLESKPANLRVARSISEEAFSARANACLKQDLAAAGESSGPVLFLVGEDELGGAFVLFDFEHDQSVFITQPPSSLPFDQHLGFSLRLADALTLRSHVFAALRNPFSLTGRLVWLTAHSGAVLVPRGAGTAGDPPSPVTSRDGMDPAQWEQRLDELVGTESYRGSMKPHIDGEAFFVSLIQAIQDARESIDIQLYIFDSDDYALRIADLLKQRSREIKVRVLVDRLGSMAAGQVPSKSPYYSGKKPLLSIAAYLQQDSAIEVRSLDNPWLTSDHTKVIVIDRARAWIGDMNIGREYRYEWHDLMVEIEGPIVGRLQKDFDKRWAYAGLGGDLAYAAASLTSETYAGSAER
jgi:hypothetical protein